MRINMSIIWTNVPSKVRVEISNGTYVSGGIMIGHGRWEGPTFFFTSPGPAHVFFAIDADSSACGEGATAVHVRDTERPFDITVADALAAYEMPIPDLGITVRAEEDKLAGL
jgi:hypothetical protein